MSDGPPPELERLVRETAALADEEELQRILAAYARMQALADAVAAARREPVEWTRSR